MISESMVQGIESPRASVPADDFALCQQFYEVLGFAARPLGPELAALTLGRHSFLLQKFHAPDLAKNFVMHLLVDDVDQWWRHIDSLDLAKRFKVRAPIAPKLQSWGLIVLFLFDPSGVLWQIASRPAQPAASKV